MKREVSMTHSVLRVSAIALGAAAFAALSPLPTALADTGSAAPSLSEPAPTPGWAETGPASTGTVATAVRHPVRYAHHYRRHYAWRNGRRYAYYDHNPVTAAATGVVGGVADLGSLAAYPFYCFPNYGSCPVYWPYP
jgi:hypothetical protein